MIGKINWMQKGLYVYVAGVFLVFMLLGVVSFVNPKPKLSESCSLGTKLQCLDFKVGPTGAVVAVKNDANKDVSVNTLKLGDCENQYESMKIKRGDTKLIPVGGCNVEGEVYQGDVKISYVEDGSRQTSEITGNLVGRVSKGDIYKDVEKQKQNETSADLPESGNRSKGSQNSDK